MKRAAAATIAVGLLAGCSLARRAPAAELTADGIVARNQAARGGLAAWRKVETMVWIGHIESAHAPSPSMPFTLEQKRPDKTRLQIEALGYRAERVFDGARGWKVPPNREPSQAVPYTAEEVSYARAGPGLDGPLIGGAARRAPVTLESLDEIGKRRAYHLKVHPAEGGDEDVWVDAETWLEVRLDRMAGGPGGAQRRVSMTYGDYRTVDGLKIPFLIETGGGPGATPDRMQIDRVVLNAPVDDSAFSNPADRSPRRWRPDVAARAAAAVARRAAPGAGGRVRGLAPP